MWVLQRSVWRHLTMPGLTEATSNAANYEHKRGCGTRSLPSFRQMVNSTTTTWWNQRRDSASQRVPD
jgi:hypothetical protein